MTEERKTPDPGATDDPRVSDVYRDIARERAPEHLDRAILREAAKAAQPRYSRWRLWTRPAAWAAVVLLSATLLLQVSQSPVSRDYAAPEVLEMQDQAAKRESSEPEADVERQRSDIGSAAKATGTAPLREEEPLADSFEAAASQDADLLLRAEEMARMQQGPNDAPACDATARSNPEDWQDCIVALVEAGFTAAAEEERRLLLATFPDFETP